MHQFLQINWLIFNEAFCKIWGTWILKRSHLKLIVCEEAHLNREYPTGHPRKASKSLYFFKWRMHPLTTNAPIMHQFVQMNWITFNEAFCKIWGTWIQSRSHLKLIICEEAHVNRNAEPGIQGGLHKVYIFQMASALINNIVHPFILHLFQRIYWLTFK